MKIRDVVIHTGRKFKVPSGIQRIDHKATHGWQLRYAGTKFYSDGPDPQGAANALALATKELLARIAKLPAPTRLQHEPSAGKKNGLPVGITGPVVRLREGSRVRSCSFAVSVPVFGGAPRRRSVYIGSENTYSPQRYREALAKAMQMRAQAEADYEQAATRAKRAVGRKMTEARRKAARVAA
jgi:hypothetical protein